MLPTQGPAIHLGPLSLPRAPLSTEPHSGPRAPLSIQSHILCRAPIPNQPHSPPNHAFHPVPLSSHPTLNPSTAHRSLQSESSRHQCKMRLLAEGAVGNARTTRHRHLCTDVLPTPNFLPKGYETTKKEKCIRHIPHTHSTT